MLVNKVDWPDDFWKFPQGGLDASEDLVEGAQREFKEEVGTSNFEVIGISKYGNTDDWDKVKDLKSIQEKKAKGQIQKFLVVKFLGEYSDIKPDGEEIEKVDWVTAETLRRYTKENKELFHAYNGLIPKILEEFRF